MGGGHSDDQLPLPTTQPDVCGGGKCTPHDDGMSTTRVSHQVLQYEGPYKGAMFSTMASHQVLHHEDPNKSEMFSTMAPHQVLHYEDHCKGEMGSQGAQQPGNVCKPVQQPGNVVSKNLSAPTEVEVDVKSVSVPTEVESVSVPTEAENVPAPTEVELDVTMDPEVGHSAEDRTIGA